MEHISWRRLLGPALACFALLALPGISPAAGAPARAPEEACPISHIVLNVAYSCALEFTVRASNGYRITVSGDPSGSGGGDDVELSAQRRNEDVVYDARGTVTPTGMKATFGRLGRVSLSFRPSGKVRRVKVPKGCLKERPAVVTAQLGSFVGTIDFHGERDYTEVSAHRARGGIGDPLANTPKKLECESRESDAERAEELKSVALGAAPASNPGISFEAARTSGQLAGLESPTGASTPKRDPYLFLALAGERAERMSIFRFVAAVGPTSDFVFDDALTSATVAPPPPFAGTGSFQRNAAGATIWTGTLSVAMPGLGTVGLTEPEFKGELATLATLLKQDEEKAELRRSSRQRRSAAASP